ncbi:hypothetical protein K7X08_032618 [Anisodus acutangulus]|uniref:Uncharacterized protein n=1 Tax=Anisodus acutangulus TaxID=402998 RepID=A0A9Q1M0M4_9SOLA|nr:hypothetical protein K7X08_032618 [Anisodus acutangulus]
MKIIREDQRPFMEDLVSSEGNRVDPSKVDCHTLAAPILHVEVPLEVDRDVKRVGIGTGSIQDKESVTFSSGRLVDAWVNSCTYHGEFYLVRTLDKRECSVWLGLACFVFESCGLTTLMEGMNNRMPRAGLSLQDFGLQNRA